MLNPLRFSPTAVCLLCVSWSLVLVCCQGVFQTGATAQAQDLGIEEFRRLHNELRERMSEDLVDAEAYLEELIAKSPDSADLNVLRESLATRWSAEGKFDRANVQLNRLIDFQIAHLEQETNRYGIPLTIQTFEQVAEDSGKFKAYRDAVDRGFEALSSAKSEDVNHLIPWSQMSVLQAQLLARKGEGEQTAKEIVESTINKLSSSASQSVEVTEALIRTLRLLTSNDPANDLWRDKAIDYLGTAVATALDVFPESMSVQTGFAEVEYLMITQWKQDEPDETKKRIDEAVSRLNTLALKNRSVNAILRRLVLHRERMSAAKPVSTLVGKEAPEWDVDGWVNVFELDRESLQGKVVLIDFWAMWCGPCIATFPHLRDWREEYGEEGFEIVGVTQYYNFRWDEETSRASRASEEVAPEDERESIDNFLRHHQLQHPVMVTPKNSEMSSEYGVRGIPHVVLIDQQGVVQLVKTGAGEATANEIEAKIRELLGKEKDS
ncbi:MAG: TlpA disulfide reductase family protein [Planctomycetota bacterium]|nr:TlpA disulfide reductase family protein [Planctomycetota bacterium]